MKNKYDWVIIALFAVGFIFWCVALSSCNAYRKIEKRPPLTTRDTSRLAGRFLKTFPIEPAIVKEGKIIVLPDSSSYWRDIAIIAGSKKDSVTTKIMTQYKDTCLSVFDRFEEGSDLGYRIGLAKGRSECPVSTKQVDTLYQDKLQTTAKLFLYSKNLVDTTKELYRIRVNHNELQSKTRSFKWSVLHLFSFVQMWLILLVTGLIIFRNPLMSLWKRLRLSRV